MTKAEEKITDINHPENPASDNKSQTPLPTTKIS